MSNSMLEKDVKKEINSVRSVNAFVLFKNTLKAT